jgi:tetratricopeptide (TPR) repeat protein
MARRPAKTGPAEPRHVRTVEIVLLSLCLCILALRVTYTEAPTAQVLLMPGSLSDTVYSLTLSGLLIFAFVLWVLWRVLGGRLRYRITGLEIGLALFMAAAIVSTVGASDKRAAITQTMMVLGPLFAALLLVQILHCPARIRIVLATVAALGAVSAYQCAEQFFVSNAITIEQYEKDPQMLLGPLGIEADTFQHFLFEHRLYSRGIRGFFTTSNSAASFAILAFSAAGALLIARSQDYRAHKLQRRYVLLQALAALLIAGGLFLTQSKGGILAFFAGVVVFAVSAGIHRWFGRQKRLAVAVLAAFVLLAGLVVGYAAVRYGLRHGRLPGGNSMLVRWQYWTASARMYADHPWAGVGPGNFSHYYPHYKPAAALESVADPHNFLLSLITQYGPLGLLGFLAMVGVPLWRSITSSAGTATADDRQIKPSFRKPALGILLVVGACLLLIRPLLIPTTAADSFDVLLYEIMALYLTPAAAFLIGFLLAAAPFEDKHGGWADPSHAIRLAALASASLAVLLHNLIDFALFEPGVWLAFWVLAACLVATRLQREPGRCVATGSGRALKLATAMAAVILLGFYYDYVWRPVYETTASIQQAQRAAATGRFDRAYDLLDAAIRADPLSPVTPNVSARLHIEHYERTAGKQPALLQEAARYFRKAVEANPADYKNYEKLAQVYERSGDKQRAYDWYLKAARLYPGCDRLWFALGQTTDRLGRTDAALDHYRRAVEIEDGYRRQFRQMYPDRQEVVSRLGEKDYQLAKKRVQELSE